MVITEVGWLYFLWNLHSVTAYFVDVQILLVLANNQERLINETIFFLKTVDLSFAPCISAACQHLPKML